MYFNKKSKSSGEVLSTEINEISDCAKCWLERELRFNVNEELRLSSFIINYLYRNPQNTDTFRMSSAMLSAIRSVFKNQQRYNSSNNQQKCNRKKYSSTALKTVRSLRKKGF